MNKLKGIKKDTGSIKRGLKIIHQLKPNFLAINIFQCVFEALLPFVNIYMSAEIINQIINKAEFNVLVNYVLITVIVNFIATAFSKLLKRNIEVQRSIFNHNYQMSISNKILGMDYESVENFEIHNLKEKIYDTWNVNGAGISQVIESFNKIVKALFTVIFSIAITYKLFAVAATVSEDFIIRLVCSPVYSVSLVILIILSIVLSMKTNSNLASNTYKLMAKIIPALRIASYYHSNYLSSYHAGKDVRLYAQNKLIKKELEYSTDNGVNMYKKVAFLEFKATSINTLASNIISFLVYMFIIIKAYIGLFAVGNIVKYIGSISQFIDGITQIMNEIAILVTNNEALQYYFDFLDIPNNKYLGKLPIEKRDDNEYEIEFKNVSFKYPNTKEYALKNFSFNLKIGERLAIVGMNGSGKTTMVKLLCRLYDPTEGVITLNGIDIRKYDYNEYLNIFSVVFQDFKMFSFSLGENVAANVEYNKEKSLAALEESGFGTRYKKMVDGLDTSLYKDFNEDGVEISGGEAQKIAIARAIYKNAPFIVLDEPTAALDPISEAEVYSKFNEIVEGRTAIYVSHRLSSCRFCDNIAVFNQGQLIQQGNHDQLIKDTKGKYYELWCAQAQYYA